MAWHDLGSESDVAPGGHHRFRSPIGDVTVFRLDGDWYALDDGCPHQGASLADGVYHDGRIICPLHSWVFDVKTGRCPRDSHEPAHTVPVRLRDGRIEIEVDDV